VFEALRTFWNTQVDKHRGFGTMKKALTNRQILIHLIVVFEIP
jgi:hypothetical protein